MSIPVDRSNSLADLAARINIEHEAAEAAIKRGAEHAMHAGDLLLEAKASLPHGQWLPWLTEHCTVSERTAQLYMRLARARPEIEAVAKSGGVADLSLRGAIEAIAPDPMGRGKAIADRVRSAAGNLLNEIRRGMEERREFSLGLKGLHPADRKAILAVFPKEERSQVRNWRWINEGHIRHAQAETWAAIWGEGEENEAETEHTD
jgi:hypothetical protein